MATGLRDEIKTMQGRRQEAEQALNDRPDRWISLSLSLWRPDTGRGGWSGDDREREREREREGRGEKGQAALGLHRCTNSGNYLSSKRRSFTSQGSNWTCQTVHLHGNDYFYFEKRTAAVWMCEDSWVKLLILSQTRLADYFTAVSKKWFMNSQVWESLSRDETPPQNNISESEPCLFSMLQNCVPCCLNRWGTKKTKTKPFILSFSSDEKDKRRWLHLIKYVR